MPVLQQELRTGQVANTRPMAPLDGVEPPPPCPLTGAPASLIQGVSVGLLRDLWRYSFGVRVDALFAPVQRFGLWRSPCGLAFFHPMIPGDGPFYDAFYRRLGAHEALSGATSSRPEFERAATFVRPGDRVLDVGCGAGGFARHVPQARYVGLEPHAPPTDLDIRAESIEAHAAANPAAYDVVCAFQVLEHVADPLAFARAMATCLAPGGRLILGVPRWPSPLTAIPNFVLNAPPHHLSWWTEDALRTLSEQLQLTVESVAPVAIATNEQVIYWMSRWTPHLTGTRFFFARWRWYLALAWAGLAGRATNLVRRPPPDATPCTLVLCARR